MSTEITNTRPGGLSSTAYDTLKFVALVVLPGLGTFYFALASIWGLPYATEVIGTISAIDVLLGTLLGISNIKFKNSGAAYDGALVIDDNTGRVTLQAPNLTLEELVAKPQVTLKTPNVILPPLGDGETPTMGSR